jgi:5-methylcytosine-specific restriction protein A
LPQKALKPCRHPGCPNLTHERYCVAHADEERTSDKNRPNAVMRGYGHKWRVESRKYLREHPYCECDACRILGRRLKSDVVDHKIPHLGDPELFWDRNNWQAMARSCHNRKTAKKDGGFGNKRKLSSVNVGAVSERSGGRRTA